MRAHPCPSSAGKRSWKVGPARSVETWRPLQMAETARVVDLSDYRRTFSPDVPSSVEARIAPDPASRAAGKAIEIEDLYSADTPSGGLIHRARALLASAERHV